jgi:rod shape determining protein RodA
MIGGAYRRLEPVLPGRGTGLPGRAVAGPRSLWQRVTSKDSVLRHTDWVLMAAVLGLCGIGTVLVWAGSAPLLSQAGASPDTYLAKQILNVVIGLAFMTGVSLLDNRVLRILAPFAYAASVLGLLAVYSPLGTTIYGSRSWIALPGGFEIEPSEYAKLGLILMTALIFGSARERRARPGVRELLRVLACALPVLALVYKEPDLGVVVIMVAILGGMTTLSGIRLRWVAALAGLGVAGVAAVLKLHLLKAYQAQRLASFLHPGANVAGSGYQAYWAKAAVGSGGLFGQGLFHGQLVSGGFLGSFNFQVTDLIFTTAGEELGFAGCAVIVFLLGLVIFRALRIASRAEDLFGLLVASGIAVWFAVEAFINIGMTIGIAPVTGIPLEFLSYGGSAMFADMIAVGLLQSIHRRHRLFG